MHQLKGFSFYTYYCTIHTQNHLCALCVRCCIDMLVENFLAPKNHETALCISRLHFVSNLPGWPTWLPALEVHDHLTGNLLCKGASNLYLLPSELELVLLSVWTGGGSGTELHILGLLLFISTHSEDVPAVLNFSSTFYLSTSFLLHLCLIPAALLSPFDSRGNNVFTPWFCLPRCNINVH